MKNPIDPQSGQEALIPVLGILPLLVVADSFETATFIGLANMLAIVITGLIVSVLRNLLPVEIRLAAVLLVAASVLSLLYVGMQYWFYALSQKSGIYLPLIAVNCLVLAWAEEFALRKDAVTTVWRTFLAGLAVLAIVIIAGVIREYSGLPLLRLPVGAFLVSALLVALYNFASNQQRQSG
jgi:electron transport complex protein RnfE